MSGKPIRLLLIFLILLITPLILPCAYGQESSSLDEGVNLYKAEKYDEAVNALLKARQEDPGSSTAAFMLGMAYKQLMDYESAIDHLKDAVTLTPGVRDALIELIDVLVRLGKTEEAEKWIAVAEDEGIEPANTAFLKGLVLGQEGRNKEAVASFEMAKSVDPDLAQPCDIQIAVMHLKESELQGAGESFRSAITVDPQSDLASFARQYLAKVDEALYAERPLHLTFSLFGQYDDNMVLKPSDYTLATDVTDEESLVMTPAFRVSYAPSLKGQWLLNSYYAVSAGLHQNHKKTHDSVINTLSVTPGYNFGKIALNLSATYSYAFVRNPDYGKYSSNMSAGPMMRIAVRNNQLMELFAGYADNKYFRPVYAETEDRDSNGLSAYASWVILFKRNSFFNLRYQYTDQDAKGCNWDNTGHSVSANVVIPAGDDVKLQLSGELTRKGFSNTHTMFDIKREDDISNFSAGISWAIAKRTSLITQYTRIESNSNIAIYDYMRNLYTIGLEYRY